MRKTQASLTAALGGGFDPQKKFSTERNTRLQRAISSDLTKIRLILGVTNSQTNRPAAMTTALQVMCRVSGRTLIFGLVCFAIGAWLGRLTAHKPVLRGLLGS